MKKLIITADDFGLSLGISKGIIKAMTTGMVTETCAMTNSPIFHEAVNLAKQAGITSMGVHLNATILSPLTDREALSFALNANGVFDKTWLKKELGSAELHALEIEFRQQIHTLVDTGLILTHLNSHHGLGLYQPKIWELFKRLSEEYDVPLRQEKELDQIDGRCLILDSSQSLKMLIPMLQQAKEGYLELCCHPGFIDAGLDGLTNMLLERERDLNWLTQIEHRDTIKATFQLINFTQLKGEANVI